MRQISTCNLKIFVFGLLVLFSCSIRAYADHLTEASGICVSDGKLLMVGDDDAGTYFYYKLPVEKHSLYVMSDSVVQAKRMKAAALATDLESIDILADGRIAVLSEDLHALVGQISPESDSCGIIVQYPSFFAELGNRGLEGVTVQNRHDTLSRVAVLWEGGYPELDDLPTDAKDALRNAALSPAILISEIGLWKNPGYINPKTSKLVTLKTPLPGGSPREVQRFRATDLVWHSWHDKEGKMIDGFIVMLASENNLITDNTKKRYQFKWLQRFDSEGNAIGEPLDINTQPKKQLDDYIKSNAAASYEHTVSETLEKGKWENINWEGMDWFEPGKSLIVIYDQYPIDPPIAFVITIPDDWK